MNKGRKRRKAEDSQERILKYATRIFAKKGLSDATFQQIANASGISQSAVLYHFSNKERLIEAVIRRVITHNHQIVGGGIRAEDDALTKLRKHFHLNVQWAINFPDEGQISLLIFYYASFRTRFSDLYFELLTAARNRVNAHLLAGIREKVFRRDLDTELMSHFLHDSLLGCVVTTIALPKHRPDFAFVHRKWELLFSHLVSESE